MTLNIVILGLVTLERLFELWLARRNTQRLLGQGAREHAPGHYPLIVAVHVTGNATVDVVRVTVTGAFRCTCTRHDHGGGHDQGNGSISVLRSGQKNGTDVTQ